MLISTFQPYLHDTQKEAWKQYLSEKYSNTNVQPSIAAGRVYGKDEDHLFKSSLFKNNMEHQWQIHANVNRHIYR